MTVNDDCEWWLWMMTVNDDCEWWLNDDCEWWPEWWPWVMAVNDDRRWWLWWWFWMVTVNNGCEWWLVNDLSVVWRRRKRDERRGPDHRLLQGTVVICLCSKAQLFPFLVKMFDHFNFLEMYRISPRVFVSYLCAVRDGYRENPYHNFFHG
jgi:hypothetical protein